MVPGGAIAASRTDRQDMAVTESLREPCLGCGAPVRVVDGPGRATSTCWPRRAAWRPSARSHSRVFGRPVSRGRAPAGRRLRRSAPRRTRAAIEPVRLDPPRQPLPPPRARPRRRRHDPAHPAPRLREARLPLARAAGLAWRRHDRRRPRRDDGRGACSCGSSLVRVRVGRVDDGSRLGSRARRSARRIWRKGVSTEVQHAPSDRADQASPSGRSGRYRSTFPSLAIASRPSGRSASPLGPSMPSKTVS